MRQTTLESLLLSASIATLILGIEPVTPYLHPALAATSTVAATPSSSTSQTRTLPAPLLKLMSEMPALKQLVPPSLTTPPPVTPSPAIGVSSTSFSFGAQQSVGTPPIQTLAIRNTGGGLLNWNATANAAWLTLSPASGLGNGTITLTVTTGTLIAGSYTTTITVNAMGATTVTIPVTLTVTPAPVPPSIGVSPTSLSFTVQQGSGNPAAQTLTISNTGGGTMSWNTNDNAAWLTLSPASGTNSGAIAVNAATGSLAVGTYSAAITLTAPGSKNVSVPVTFTVTAAPVPPSIGAAPSSLAFAAQQGGGNPVAQTLSISNTGGGTLTWNASDSVAWLGLSPTSGANNGTINVTATTGTLAPGTYNTTVILSAIGATSVQIPVTFTVAPAPPSLVLSQSSLTYAGAQGGSAPANQTITVTSNGNWTVTDTAPWLTLNPVSGSGNGSISASVNLGSLSVGTHTAVLTVTAGSTTRTVNVTLAISTAALTLSPASLAFTATQGAANPSPQAITFNATGTWTASDNAPWLSLSPTSGSNNGTITANINTASAKPGNNAAIITITSGSVTKTATVTLTLNAPSSSSATLSWNANKEKDLAGYKVYRATASGAYGAPIATLPGNVTTYQATGLQFGITYFFVVTAYDIAGNESAYSNEVSKSIF